MEPVKYLKIVAEMLTLYQRQLLRLFKKHPHEYSPQFSKNFSTTLMRLKQTQLTKSISDSISPHCFKMSQYLKSHSTNQSHQPHLRVNKTSVEARRNMLKSQDGTRLMGLTGGLRRREETIEEEENQLNDIIQSYKIQEEIQQPRMRMKWKSGYQPEDRYQEKDISTIGNNNINLLSYAIPQIQNSIRRLSLQRSPKSTKQREFQMYRTLESRSNKKKYIARLF